MTTCTTTTPRQLAQLQTVASPRLLKDLDHACIELDTSRAELGRLAGVHGVVIAWAFGRGKSARAAKVRQIIVRELQRMSARREP